ncbi:hypothetical protein ACQPT2_14850 [Erwinia amylovora]
MIDQGWLIRWLHQPLWLRLLSLVVGSALLALALWHFGLRPIRMEAEVFASQHHHQEQRYQASLRAVLSQPSLQSIEADIVRLQQSLMPEECPVFSLPVLIARGAGQLALWQPDGQGGELTIKLRWQGVQAVLHYLSKLQTGATLPHFNLRAEQEQLHFTMALGLDHEA